MHPDDLHPQLQGIVQFLDVPVIGIRKMKFLIEIFQGILFKDLAECLIRKRTGHLHDSLEVDLDFFILFPIIQNQNFIQAEVLKIDGLGI